MRRRSMGDARRGGPGGPGNISDDYEVKTIKYFFVNSVYLTAITVTGFMCDLCCSHRRYNNYSTEVQHNTHNSRYN